MVVTILPALDRYRTSGYVTRVAILEFVFVGAVGGGFPRYVRFRHHQDGC
jgi:hypothetical protein